MATGLEPSVAADVLNALLNATAYTGPATLFVKLHVGDPGSAGTANPAGNDTRKAISFAASSETTGICLNDAAITWSTSEVDTAETYTHVSIWDAVTSGNFIASGTITANAVQIGDQLTVNIGGVSVTLSIAA